MKIKISRILIFVNQTKFTGFYISAIYIIILLPAALSLHTSGSYLITSENDFFSSYVPHSIHFLNGNFIIDVYRGPLYVFILSALKLFVNNYLTAGILISSLSAAGFIFFIYNTISKIFNPRFALITCLLLSVNQVFLFYSFGCGTDMFFCFLASGSLYFFLSRKSHISKERLIINIIMSGIFSALAFLTRYNGIFLTVSIAVILIYGNDSDKVYDRLKPLLVYGITFIILILPWGIYTYKEKGTFFYNENYKNIALSLSENDDDWEEAWLINSKKFSSSLQIIKDQPLLIMKTLVKNSLSHSFKTVYLLSITGIFTLAGLIFYKRSNRSNHQNEFFFFNIVFFLLLLPFFFDHRFVLFLFPSLMLLACQSISKFSDYFYFPSKIIITILLAASLILGFSQNLKALNGQKEVEKIAYEYQLKFGKQMRRNDLIASRFPHISYHLNMRWTAMPINLSAPNTILELKKRKVNYLYFSRREYYERPLLRELINPLKAPKELSAVLYLPKEKAVLYKIVY